METKEELVTNIKEWIQIDNEIAMLQNEIKERRNKKKNLTQGLMNVMKTNEIDCFDINGGALIYKKHKVKKALNGKSLMNIIQSYFEDTPNKAQEVTKFVMENRTEEVKESIRRKVDK
jgi:hypothetical protein